MYYLYSKNNYKENNYPLPTHFIEPLGYTTQPDDGLKLAETCSFFSL
jgi:hypothetical protein